MTLDDSARCRAGSREHFNRRRIRYCANSEKDVARVTQASLNPISNCVRSGGNLQVGLNRIPEFAGIYPEYPMQSCVLPQFANMAMLFEL